MKLSVDKGGDALHLRLDDSSVLESKEVEPGIALDYNASNEVVGIRMLHLSERSSPPELSVVEFQAASGGTLRHSLDAANDEEPYDETPTPAVSTKPNPFLSASLLLGRILVATALFVADRLIDLVLALTTNSRALPRTKRIRFSREVRRAIRDKQGGNCMYCRVRLYKWNMHIDHVFPAEHGGSNDISNLQALCGDCNQRKGVQTDEEFRTRYGKILPAHGRPRRRIQQSEFAAITAKTEQLESTRTRKRSVFKTQRQRVVSGSCTLGIIALVSSLVVLAMSPLADIQVILLGVPVVIGVGVSIGLIRRARHTGRLTDEA